MVRDSREELLKFQEKIDRRYGTSLCSGGSGRWLKDSSRKFGWLREKEDVGELRRKLQMDCGIIHMFCNAAIG